MRFIPLLLCLLMVNCHSDVRDSPASMTTENEANTGQEDSAPENISVEFVTGQFEFEDHPDFVRVADSLSDKTIYLQKPTYEAFLEMAAHADDDGVDLIIISGTRNFMVQKSIWDRKWENSEEESGLAKAREILLYSSMPMTSRHHWGTDIDLNNLSNSWFEDGKGKRVYDWLTAHANDYGFYQPYTDKSLNNRTGYEEERWHWSYMLLAHHYLEFYNENITNEDINGFKGSDLAPQINMVDNYVNGLSEKVKNY